MKRDDNATALDQLVDGEDTGLLDPDPEAPGLEPAGPADSLEPEADDELLEAELGERDIDFPPDLGDLLDDLDSEDESDPDELADDAEIALLQELGIDLDAADPPEAELEFAVGLGDDDPVDDEVAA